MRSDLTFHFVDQRTDEWQQLRAGRLTGTRAAAMLAKGRGKAESTTKRDLRLQLVCERLAGRSLEDNGFQSPWMKRGTELEPEGIAAYEAVTGQMVQAVGFVSLDREDLPVGCSPDGLIGHEGVLELKCPKPATHMRYWQESELPSEYVAQIRHALWVTGAAWCDFVSYCPVFPDALQLYVYRVMAAEAKLDDYAKAVGLFLTEVDEQLSKVQALLEKAKPFVNLNVKHATRTSKTLKTRKTLCATSGVGSE